MKRSIFLSALLAGIALVTLGCQQMNRDRDHADSGDAKPTGKVAVAKLHPSKAATTQPSMNNVTGMLTFTEMADMRIHVTGEVRGLTPNTEHGFHLHEKGDLSAPDFASAGAHFNPSGEKHGGPHADQRHVGDLGNIMSDSKGVARVNKWVHDATLGGKHAIVGRSVLVHAQRDDLKTDPAGDAGARISGGVIEMKP